MTEQQLTFIREYNTLLELTEEALHYLGEERLNSGSPVEERVFYDSILAFFKINEMNEVLVELFQDDEEKLQAIRMFDGIVYELDKLGSEPFHATTNTLNKTIIPAFESWKLYLQSKMKAYIFH